VSQLRTDNLPTIERLRELFDYDPSTGLLTWKEGRKGRFSPKGSVAGRPRKSGHVFVGIDGPKYAAHRVAWAIHYGEWPTKILDHINRDPSDNRIENLRQADKILNAHNSGKWATNTSGFKCVYWNKQRNKWMVKVMINGFAQYLGLYETKEAAHAAHVCFEKRLINELERAK